MLLLLLSQISSLKIYFLKSTLVLAFRELGSSQVARLRAPAFFPLHSPGWVSAGAPQLQVARARHPGPVAPSPLIFAKVMLGWDGAVSLKRPPVPRRRQHPRPLGWPSVCVCVHKKAPLASWRWLAQPGKGTGRTRQAAEGPCLSARCWPRRKPS